MTIWPTLTLTLTLTPKKEPPSVGALLGRIPGWLDTTCAGRIDFEDLLENVIKSFKVHNMTHAM